MPQNKLKNSPIYTLLADQLLARREDIASPLPLVTTCADEDDVQQLTTASADLIYCPHLLTVTDTPHEHLTRMANALKPDGLLLACVLGQRSFSELAALHIPTPQLPDVEDVGQLLTQLKYALPVIDRYAITLTFPNFTKMQERFTEVNWADYLPNTCNEMQYKKHFRREDDRLPITLDILFIHAWKPHKSQPQPLKPGQYKVSFAEAFTTKK